jgi:probable rRNA maturation factor
MTSDGGADNRQTLYVRSWRVDIVRREDIATPLPGAGIARTVARALEAAAAPRPGSVTVVLSDDDELAELNAEHMGHDGPTDVLSFPMLPPDSFVRKALDDPGPRPHKPAAIPPPEVRSRTHIGDVAISVERAIVQAVEGRGGHTGDVQWSPRDEMRLLVTHGTLHLCGWDHARPQDEAAMRALERELLASG